MKRIILCLLLVCFAGGCATTRDIYIETHPADAQLAIDGESRGPAPLTESFKFGNDFDTHTVTATRPGYTDQSVRVTKDYAGSRLLMELRPRTKRVSFTCLPLPGVISVDGKPLSPDPVTQTTAELEFTLDAKNQWTSHVVSAERPGFKKVEQKVQWSDASPEYVLNLDVLRKDLSITTTPPGAQITINNETLGISPVTYAGWPFPVKPDTGEYVPQKVRATKPGYDPAELPIAWDDAKGAYHLTLPVKTKTVRLVSSPPGAVIKIDGVDVRQDAAGVATAHLTFPPTDDKGTLRTYTGSAVRAASDTIWEPLAFSLHWDEGKTDYTLPLREIKTRDVELLTAKPTFVEASGWSFVPQRIKTIGLKDTVEPGDASQLTKLTDLPKGTMIDTLTVSPDGSQVLMTTLASPSANELASTMLSVRSDGSGVTTVFSDGKSLDLTPSYTPDGSQIVFASNRGGKHLSIWEMSANGDPGITQLTTEESDLWPVVDSDPKPRLFYEALIDVRSDPRIFMTQLGATTRTDLTRAGGTQPRVSPKGDSILFTAINQKSGKRQIYRVPDRGGVPVTLSNPESDEFDAVWSLDGTRIAYVSDRGTDEENRNNYDLWILDLSHPEKPIRVTRNGSWDDCPAWDPNGRFLCFRSNRGGQWGVWKINLK